MGFGVWGLTCCGDEAFVWVHCHDINGCVVFGEEALSARPVPVHHAQRAGRIHHTPIDRVEDVVLGVLSILPAACIPVDEVELEAAGRPAIVGR